MAPSTVSRVYSPKGLSLFERAARLSRPATRLTPDEWARQNREYPPSAGVPGPRRPELTPYAIPVTRAVAARIAKRVVFVCGAQMGKTDSELDVIGHRFDQAPAPVLFAGPNKQFLNEQFEPRVMALLDEAPALKAKVARGKRMTKTRKVIAGNQLRLAHGGSPTALKSDAFALAITDEVDDLLANVKGQGDPITLIDRRGDTYADFVHLMTSTPSQGPKEIAVDPESGLAFWADQDPEDIASKIWALWQEGTRYHWAWRCPECREFFVPRFECVEIPDVRKTTPARARKEARLICPRNGCVIDEAHKPEMNATGVYVAPGQWVDEDGVVQGDAPEAQTISFWVSGLASPFVSWGERAAAYVAARQSGDQEQVRAVINGGFGELWAPAGGDVPEWEEVSRKQLGYREGEVPEGAVFLTMGVDVQKTRLVYVVRAWGPRQESWLVTRGEIWGDTSGYEDRDADGDVWSDLDDLLDADFGGMHIARCFVDAGYRPGKKDLVPEHKVYEFARRRSRTVFATKGFDTRPTPLTVNRIDVTAKGGKAKFGLDLVRLSTDFFKSWVHERLRWPEDQPGGWHLFEGIDEAYCRQIVSEARVRKPKGNGFVWVQKSRDNHFLDAESLSYAAAYMLGVTRMRDGARPAGEAAPVRKREQVGAVPASQERAPAGEVRKRAPGFLGGRRPGGYL